MPAEKEKPDSTNKPAQPAPGIETVTAPPGKVAGPQPLARAAETSGNPAPGGAAGRARMVGNMQQNVGNARVGRMLGAGVQRKTEVSSPEDDTEKEADQTAEKVMRMSDTDAGVAPARSDAPSPGPTGGGGQPLSKADREFMEPRIGRSFDDVRLHTDREAQGQATGIGAKAFTRGSDISFGPGSGPDDKKLLAHELTHVAQQGAGNGPDKAMRAPGPLTPAQEASAVNFTRNQYDERSIRIIQLITGTAVDGRFGDISAQAVAVWQVAHGLGMDGKVGANTLNQMVIDRAIAGFPEHAIQLCIDFHNLNVRRETLSVQFEPEDAFDFLRNLFTGAPSSSVVFGPGNLRVIRVGPRAFFSEPTLFAAINAQLTAPAPAVPPLGPRPALLTPAQELAAISFNRSVFNDRRSVLAIQGHVAATPDGVFGPDTVQRIADAQRISGLTVDGKVGEATLEIFVLELAGLDFQDAAIRLIVDFFNFRDNGNLLEVYFDPTEPDAAATDFRPNEPVRVTVGPSGMAQPFAGIVHSIAHEFEHVRRLRQGIADADTNEFLGEAVEILSVGMPQEAIENVAVGNPAFVEFMNDAERALHHWNLMPLADQRNFRSRFVAVRARVRARLAAATAAQQALHAPTLAAYNAVVLP